MSRFRPLAALLGGMSAPARIVDDTEPPSARVTTLRAPDEGTTPDAELVQRARAGDEWASAAIYHRHAGHVANLSLRLLRDHEEAADATQDTFAIAFSDLSKLADPSRLRAWLRRIAVNRAQRRFRRWRLLRLLGLQATSISFEDMASPNASPEVRLQLKRADVALRGLSDRQRTVWTLRVVEGETLPAIAEQVGCSLATVKRDLSKATDAVRAAVQEGA